MTVADVVAADGMDSKAAALLELVQSEHAPWDENAQACASVVVLRMHLGETRRHWLARSSVWWEVGAHTHQNARAVHSGVIPPQRRPTPTPIPILITTDCSLECLQRYLRARGGDVR